MKILQVNSARYFGGGERHVVDLARGLGERGHQVFAAVARDAAMRGELEFLPEKQMFELSFGGPADIGAARSLARLAKEHSIDLLHAHVARDYTVVALASRLSRVPFVITRHVLFPMSRVHRVLLRGARFVIAPSNAVANALLSQGIFAKDKIVTVRHGLVTTRKPRSAERPAEAGKVVGSVGNLDAVKGFDVLIRAAQLVIDKEPDTRFEIAGEDREADRHNEHELRSLIDELDLADDVHLTGWAGDLPATLSRYDLFVSASRSESFGYALADAMLAGVPVVATDTEGAREVVGKTSVLVPIDSPVALAEAIISMLEDPALRGSVAEKGRQHVANEFSLGRMIDETEAVYRLAIADG